jgi:DNA (cytosine-5)-methyltransferase 1
MFASPSTCDSARPDAQRNVVNGMALCAGAGGLELALHVALGDDYRCVVYVEREAYAAATLVARMADQTLDTAPVWDDITTFYGEAWSGVVDLVSAGFSCQPWSPAGKRLGIEDERWLWPDIDRIIREVGPEWVFLENVPGLVHGGIEHVLGSLAAQGFAAEWDCVSAAEVGASQLRERLYILARSTRGGLGMVREPSWGRGQFDGDRQVVDDADTRRRWRQDHEVRSGQSRPERTEPTLGDAEHDGCDPVTSASLRWSDDSQSRREPQGSEQQLGESHPTASERPQRFAADAGYWPPDRNYRGEWPSDFEPAVRRVADGMAPWVDRLRLTGNGVVPLGAAVAFLRLRDRLMEQTA